MTENQRRYQKAREAYIARAKKWRENNYERHKMLTKEWAARNREKVKGYNNRSRWTRAGIKDADQAVYDRLLEEQQGLCAICNEPPKRRKLALDHDHDTGKIRGLLCYGCNVGLGYLQRFERIGMERCKTYLANTP